MKYLKKKKVAMSELELQEMGERRRKQVLRRKERMRRVLRRGDVVEVVDRTRLCSGLNCEGNNQAVDEKLARIAIKKIARSQKDNLRKVAKFFAEGAAKKILKEVSGFDPLGESRSCLAFLLEAV